LRGARENSGGGGQPCAEPLFCQAFCLLFGE